MTRKKPRVENCIYNLMEENQCFEPILEENEGNENDKEETFY